MSPEMLQQLNLSQSTFRQDLLAEHVRDFFDSNAVARDHVGGGTAWELLAIHSLTPTPIPLAASVDIDTIRDNRQQLTSGAPTRQYHMRPDPAPW